MIKIAIVIWVVLGTTLAGCALLIVLGIDTLAERAMTLIPISVLSGFLVAMPLSFLVARRLSSSAAA